MTTHDGDPQGTGNVLIRTDGPAAGQAGKHEGGGRSMSSDPGARPNDLGPTPGGGGLMDAEDVGTQDNAVVDRWLKAYSEVVSYTTHLLETSVEQVGGMSPDAEFGALEFELMLRLYQARLRVRLDFWAERKLALTRASEGG